MLYPLKFEPILFERVWGGRALARYDKKLPSDQPYGESWEISDRDDAQSKVANGPDAGKTLRQLIQENGVKILGTNCLGMDTAQSHRFPLLVKLLDARDRLSLQVHPPASVAAKLGGEPKTEMWYILDAEPHAHLIAGLRSRLSRESFKTALESNTLEECIHRFPVSCGDAVFIPSGRLHAIDAGLVIVEIQQNSDTTYRVYDWRRAGLDGKPRQLHVDEALASIDFEDSKPAILKPLAEEVEGDGLWRLVECQEFHVQKITLRNAWRDRADGSTFHVLVCVGGELGIVTADGAEHLLKVGESALIPAALGYYKLTPQTDNTVALKSFVPPR